MPSINYDADNHRMDKSFLDASIPALVAQLTLDEKRELLAGQGWWHTTPVPRLNIPSIKVSDGPNGARGGSFYNPTPGVAVPPAICVAASFDMELVKEMGGLLAEEAKARGAVCLLGPCTNVPRSPLGGRAFESPSEDPTLSGHFAAAYINGLERGGVSSSLKHWVCNDQENDRNGSDSIVAPRALREVYMRPFQLALRMSKPSNIMASYNKVNGTHVSDSKELLDGVLRQEWGFDGMIVSDWNGTYSCADALNAGLDLEFPGPTRWRTKLLFEQAYDVHKITMRQIDKNVTNILRWVQKLARANTELVYSKEKEERTRSEAQANDAVLLRKLASEGIVLLKNENSMLPLKPKKPTSVAVIGPHAKAQVFTGGGSARLLTSWGITAFQGLDAGKPEDVTLGYAMGTSTAKFLPMLDDNFTANGEVGFDIYHYPVLEDGTMGEKWLVHDHLYRSEIKYHDFGAPGLENGYFAEIKTTFKSPVTGKYQFGLCITGKGWFYVDGELVWSLTDYKSKGRSFYGSGTDEQVVSIDVEEGKNYELRVVHDFREPPHVTYVIPAAFRYGGIRLGAQPLLDSKSAMEEAVDLASQSDVAVLVIGLGPEWETEGVDRADLSLPMATNELVSKVAAANPNTVVVIQAGSAVLMPWINDVKAVVQAWYGGNETGNAIADIIYGKVNPAGRLPMTFPRSDAHPSAALSRFSQAGKIYYDDNIYVGYKHYNAREIAPLFPFGHGLSYTTFQYANLKITSAPSTAMSADDWKLTATVEVTNTGAVPGSHSVHFYTCPPPRKAPLGLLHPSHSLQGFVKLHDLAPGETRTAKVTLDRYAISHWDEIEDTWVAESGTWGLAVGVDAQTLVERCEFEVGSGLEWTGL